MTALEAPRPGLRWARLRAVPDTPPAPTTYSVEEVAALLGVHRSTITRAVADGTIPNAAAGLGRAIRIPATWVDDRLGTATGTIDPTVLDDVVDAVERLYVDAAHALHRLGGAVEELRAVVAGAPTAPDQQEGRPLAPGAVGEPTTAPGDPSPPE